MVGRIWSIANSDLTLHIHSAASILTAALCNQEECGLGVRKKEERTKHWRREILLLISFTELLLAMARKQVTS